ncbi:MAG: hypothetical protein M0Z87_04705 [Actinomycetota bacterium]|nr:hypothetical protein [Actinomycetota bacterium]
MGTTIRATCPTCGDVELGVADLTALLCSTTQAASYSFRCPRCRMLVAKPTGRQVVDVLVSSGVELRYWRLPAELGEVHHGPPLAPADVISLRAELTRDDWYQRLVSAGSGESI